VFLSRRYGHTRGRFKTALFGDCDGVLLAYLLSQPQDGLQVVFDKALLDTGGGYIAHYVLRRGEIRADTIRDWL